jgi:hypothetical protein
MDYTANEQSLIDSLRSTMSMRATGESAFVSAAKLSDEELYDAIRDAVDYVNGYPPPLAIAYTPDNIPATLIGPMKLIAIFWCMVQLGIFEIGKHFQYNDNGISLGRDRSDKYMRIADSLLNQAEKMLQKLKLHFAFSNLGLRGQFSSTLSVPRSLLRGLRGTRQGSGN